MNPIETQLEALLQQMTLAEKVAQMTQPEKNSITPAEVREHSIGSVLSGGGGRPSDANTAPAWRAMVTAFVQASLESRLQIPLIYGVDAVHGHNNVYGATLFPHNIGLGATRDAHLVERIAQATAREIRATGIVWDFAPAVPVVQDMRWGRTYESYGQDTATVSELASAFVRGLQSHGVLPSVKHYIGDGATTWATRPHYTWLPFWDASTGLWQIDQGDAQIDEATLRAVHLPPYQAALAAGAMNVMISYSAWNGLRMHAHRYLITDVLKGELGFSGFTVSDWMGINQIHEDYRVCVIESINAGLDMVMVPFDWKGFMATTIQAVEAGDIPLARIDDAVRRILRAKLSMGLFANPIPAEAGLMTVGCAAHRNLAREAVQKSAVLLKNDNAALPLNADSIGVAGQAAHDIGLACGGWSIEWGGNAGPITLGTTLWTGLEMSVPTHTRLMYSANGEFAERVAVGVVVIAEQPYAEGFGDKADLALTDEQVALIQRVRATCERLVLVIYSGRPLIITPIEPLCDAIVAAWLAGSEAHGLADVLVGRVAFTGKLPIAWPRNMAQVPLAALMADAEPPLYPLGWGL